MQALARSAHLLDDERGLHLYPLLTLLLKELGPEFLAWDSLALRLELSERWGEPGPLTWERIQAGRIMAGHDGFWIHCEIFENCGLALAGEIPVFSHFQPLEAESIAVILHTAALIKEHPFSEEVRSYMVSCCLEDATWFLEEPLDMLQADLEWYDDQRKIKRDFDSVRKRLDTRPTAVGDPISYVDVQVNSVISVREILAKYKGIIDHQIKELLR
tara:strand:- start:324 stop:971 length:648 start_codon:yes stop_codon:yes gene_type:complete